MRSFANDKCDSKTELCLRKGRKPCRKRRKCWLVGFSPLPTVVSKEYFLRVIKSRNCAVKCKLFTTQSFVLMTLNKKVFGWGLFIDAEYIIECNTSVRLIQCIGTYNSIALTNRYDQCLSKGLIQLTLSQTTNFRLFQTERVCRRQL